MAKNDIPSYDATAANNTDVQSVDISENCSPAGINNAIREVMADLKNVDTGAVALTSPQFASASMTGNLDLGDNVRARFGSGNDLQIYHDGSDSYINDTGTGNLRLAGAAGVDIIADSGETMAKFISNGASELYHNNGKSLETTSVGVTVNGNLGIGTAAPAHEMHIQGSSTTASLSLKGSGTGTATSDGIELKLQGDNSAYLYNYENAMLRFGTNGLERMRILSGGGLTFNGDTAAANALDDYEEGTWTPTASGGYTVSSASGAYTKIGRVVHLWGTVQFSVVGGNTSTVVLGSAPFTNSTHLGTGVCRENTNTGAIYVFRIAPNSTSMEINTMTGVASGTRTIRTGENYAFHGSYYVA